MAASRLSPRKIWLIIADTAIIYGGVVLAIYLRLGVDGAEEQLNDRFGWYKAALATFVCLLNLYFYDLYDYIVMTDRRELLLRMVQALGIS